MTGNRSVAIVPSRHSHGHNCSIGQMQSKGQMILAARVSRPAPDFFVGIARAGSPDSLVAAGSAAWLAGVEFGPPLHILVVPADLHPVEQEYLEVFTRYERG